MLLSIIHDDKMRAQYVKGELVVVMSDTGNEHPYTYKHVDNMKTLCAEHQIEFHLLTSQMGFHRPSWPDL